MEIGEADSFGGELVDVGSCDFLCAVAADVGVAEVIGEDEDDVGATFGRKS